MILEDHLGVGVIIIIIIIGQQMVLVVKYRLRLREFYRKVWGGYLVMINDMGWLTVCMVYYYYSDCMVWCGTYYSKLFDGLLTNLNDFLYLF